jgi:hypothetical protein
MHIQARVERPRVLIWLRRQDIFVILSRCLEGLFVFRAEGFSHFSTDFMDQNLVSRAHGHWNPQRAPSIPEFVATNGVSFSFSAVCENRFSQSSCANCYETSDVNRVGLLVLESGVESHLVKLVD